MLHELSLKTFMKWV